MEFHNVAIRHSRQTPADSGSVTEQSRSSQEVPVIAQETTGTDQVLLKLNRDSETSASDIILTSIHTNHCIISSVTSLTLRKKCFSSCPNRYFVDLNFVRLKIISWITKKMQSMPGALERRTGGSRWLFTIYPRNVYIFKFSNSFCGL